MEEIDISSVESTPRTDDLVICYQSNKIKDQTTSESLKTKDLIGSFTDETFSDEDDLTKSSDVVFGSDSYNCVKPLVSRTNGGSSINVNCDSELLVTKISNDNPSDKENSDTTDKKISDIKLESISSEENEPEDNSNNENKLPHLKQNKLQLPQVLYLDRESRPQLNLLSGFENTNFRVDKEVQFCDKLQFRLPSVSSISSNSKTFFVHSRDDTRENIGNNNSLKWNMQASNEAEDLSGRYVPSLGYRPLKNILDCENQITKSTFLFASDRPSVRIKRPWFYEITIEEEEEEEKEDGEKNFLQELRNKLTQEQLERKPIKVVEEHKLKLDRDKNDEVNLGVETNLTVDNKTKLPSVSNSIILNDTSISKNHSNDSKLQINKAYSDLNKEQNRKCRENKTDNYLKVPKGRRRKSYNFNEPVSDLSPKQLNVKCESNSNTSSSMSLKVPKRESRKKLNLELNIDEPSGSVSTCSELGSESSSICRLCKRSSQKSTPERTPDTLRRQERYIIKHLELLNLGRLLLENPQLFRKKGSRKSMYNNRKNMSFSNDRLRDIEWANKVLLNRIVSTSRRKPKILSKLDSP